MFQTLKINPCRSVFLWLQLTTGLEIMGGHHCGRETEYFQPNRMKKYSEKSLLHSDDCLLFPVL